MWYYIALGVAAIIILINFRTIHYLQDERNFYKETAVDLIAGGRYGAKIAAYQQLEKLYRERG